MLATSSSSNFTPLKLRAGWIGSCGQFSLCVALSTDILLLLSLHTHFPLLSIFHDFFCHFDPCVVVSHFISFRRFSFLRFEEMVTLIFLSFFGLPTGLFVCTWC